MEVGARVIFTREMQQVPDWMDKQWARIREEIDRAVQAAHPWFTEHDVTYLEVHEGHTEYGYEVRVKGSINA